MKFDQHVANYQRQLNEAAIGDFFRALTKNPEKLQQAAMPSLRLENPKKNLAVLYQKLKISDIAQGTQPPDKSKALKANDIVTGTGQYNGKYIVIQDKGPTVIVQPYSEKNKKPYNKPIELSRTSEIVESWIIEATQQKQNAKLEDILNPNTGEIISPDRFAVVLYNAFSYSSDGIVSLDNLIRQRIGGDKYARSFGEETPYNRELAKASIQKFIKDKGLDSIIKMYDTYEAAQKGSKGLQWGTAVRNAAVGQLKSLGNMATQQGMTEI